jgi:hypothetical protein
VKLTPLIAYVPLLQKAIAFVLKTAASNGDRVALIARSLSSLFGLIPFLAKTMHAAD